MSEFQLPHPLQHNMAGHQVIPTEFWPPNFGLHPPFNPTMLHPNIMPNYKLPNIQAILSQYMGNLGFFAYPQNLTSAAAAAAAAAASSMGGNNNGNPTTPGGSSRVSPVLSNCSPKDSPPPPQSASHSDVDK